MNTNATITVDFFYKNYAATPFTYYGALYGLTSLSSVSIIMNYLAYKILRNKAFHSSNIFTYIRYNVFNSLIISILLLTRFLITNYNLHDISNTHGAQVYASYFFVPLLSIFYFNGNLLDIYIIIERINFIIPENPLKFIAKIKYFWFIIVMASLVINLPNFFFGQIYYVDVILNEMPA